MKKGIFFLPLYFMAVFCSAQTINLEPPSPAPQFQDADVGSIEFGDIDNDGDLDFMATGKGGPIKSTLYRNDGTGNFTEVLGSPFIDVFGGMVGFEDVDNDGDQDLLITGKTSSPILTVNLYLNDGNGNYTLVPNTTLEPSEAGEFAFGDVDNDGDKDLIMTGFDVQGQGFSKMYLNDGTGNFSEVSGTPFEAVRSSSIAFIDIENDNDLDVVIAGENNSSMPVTNLYANDGTGTFTLVANMLFANTSEGDISVADSDNDGDEDILISGLTVSSVSISELYINDGLGTFTPLASSPFPGILSGANDFADFDNDGDYDVLIIGAGTTVLANIYENQGGNNFVLADTVAGAYLSSTAIGDIDGDNDLDLVISGTSFTAPVRSTKTYTNLTQITVATDQELNKDRVSIYPNPSQGTIHVDLQQATDATFTLYNTAAELVYVNDHLRPQNQLSFDLPAGLYFLVIKSQDQISTHKVVLE